MRSCYPYSGGKCTAGDTGLVGEWGYYPFRNNQGKPVGFLFLEEDFGNALPTGFGFEGWARSYDWQPSLDWLAVSFTCGNAPTQLPQLPPSGGKTHVEFVAQDCDHGFESYIQADIEVFYNEVSYDGSVAVTDRVGGKRVITLFT